MLINKLWSWGAGVKLLPFEISNWVLLNKQQKLSENSSEFSLQSSNLTSDAVRKDGGWPQTWSRVLFYHFLFVSYQKVRLTGHM